MSVIPKSSFIKKSFLPKQRSVGRPFTASVISEFMGDIKVALSRMQSLVAYSEFPLRRIRDSMITMSSPGYTQMTNLLCNASEKKHLTT